MDKFQIAIWSIGGFTALTISLYLSGVLYFLLNGFNPDIVMPWTIFEYITYLHKPYGTYLLISFIAPNVVFAILAAFIIFKPVDRNARWATLSDIKKAGLLHKKGIILGKHQGNFLINDDPTHVFVLAPTRSGKGIGLVIPNLLDWEDSFICLDVKGENHRVTSGFRKSFGHKVINFVPFSEDKKSHCYNPLDFVSKDKHKRITDLQIMATTIIELGEKSEPHFPAEGRQLFVGLALYVIDNQDMPSTIGSIFRLLGTENEFGDLLKHIVETTTNLDEASRQLFNSYSYKAEKEKSGIKSTLGVALQLWLNPVIDAVTSKSDFNFEELRKRRHAIYLGVELNDLKTLAPLMRILFEQAINKLTNYEPDKNKKQLKVLMLMDEIHTLGKMEVMTNAFTLLAGANVRLIGVVQNLELLDKAYGHKSIRNTILSNCAQIVFFASKDPETQKYVSTICGETTAQSKSISKSHGFSYEKPKVSISEKRVPLIRSDEINTFGEKKQIILVEKHYPVKCKRIDYRKENLFKQRLLEPVPTPDLVITSHAVPKFDISKKNVNNNKSYAKRKKWVKQNGNNKEIHETINTLDKESDFNDF